MNEKEQGISELLEQDREALLARLRLARLPERAEAVAEEELELVLMRYNAQCGSVRQREAASAMMETAGAALGLLNTVGEIKIWAREQTGSRGRVTAGQALLLSAGLLLCAGAFLLLLRGIGGAVLPGALLAGGMGVELLAGYRIAAARYSAVPEHRAEASTDCEKVYACLRTAALVMDRNLQEAASSERWALRSREDGGGLDRDTLELLGTLLEAAYSGDGGFALDKLRELRHFLHGRGIELVEYSDGTAGQFDVMPALARATLRPALVREGRVLLRGLAAEE